MQPVIMETVEKQFEDFFAYCGDQQFSIAELLIICRPLLWSRHLRRLQQWAVAVTVIVVLYLLFSYCDMFTWSLTAVSRLLLIQLLPMWNWTPFYNAKCLIERPQTSATSKAAPPLGPFETEPGNCNLCATLESLPTIGNVSFTALETTYLERGYPVIVTDSHEPQTLGSMIANMQKATAFVDSEPCDLVTNLMLPKRFQLSLALQQVEMSLLTDKWFLQLRNCRFSSVKASRLFMRRPYYYSAHLAPFYSSWLLLAHNYALPRRALDINGLIFVQQLSGSFKIQLRPKQPCDDICPLVSLRLHAGECLLFATDLWMLSYEATEQQSRDTAMASIMETDWQL